MIPETILTIISFEIFIVYLSKTLIKVTIFFLLYIYYTGNISLYIIQWKTRPSFSKPCQIKFSSKWVFDLRSFTWLLIHFSFSALELFITFVNLVNVFVTRLVCLFSVTSASVMYSFKVKELNYLRKFHGQESHLIRDRV